MSDTESATQLKAGIAAAKAGERAQARELLQRVVEADERNVTAWLWLSSVVTTLEDREVCLENVLELEPGNVQAQQGLEWVRTQMRDAPLGVPEITTAPIEVQADVRALRDREELLTIDFTREEFDDPLLCVYCAQPTAETDRRCPTCKRPLYSSYYKRERPGWLWMGWTIGVVDVFYSGAMLLLMVVILAAALSAARFTPDPIDTVQLLRVYVGQAEVLPAAQAVALNVLPREVFMFRVAYLVFTLVTTLGLITRRRPFHILYMISIAITVVNIYFYANMSRDFITSGVPLTALQGIVQVIINEMLGVYGQAAIGLAVLIVLLKAALTIAMEEDFDKITERLWCKIDPTVREPVTAYVRAKNYMKRDMWTLAAMYLRKAISLQPTTTDYYLALAEALAHLKRYAQSLALLDQAERLQPDSAGVANLRRVISELNARQAGGL